MSYYLSSTLAFAGMVVQLFVLFLVLTKVGDRCAGPPKAQECEQHAHH